MRPQFLRIIATVAAVSVISGGAAIIASVAGCTSRSERAQGTPVIIVSVDTLRPDHLYAYGYSRETARTITSFAQDAVVFTRAFTTAAKTTPAHASMFTGKYPHKHGLTLLGEELAEENLTIAELLRENGYQTSAFVSSTVMINRLSRLGQGFQLWDDHMPSREANRDNFERKASATIDSVLERWSASAGPPFLFVHLIDPHGPYIPPPLFRLRFKERKGEYIDPEKVPEFQRLAGAVVIGDYVDAYDGEVAYADHELGKLLEEVRRRGLYERALIIITSDHGESFGEDGYYFRHGKTLHEVSTRVPLLIKPPGGRAAAVEPLWDGVVSLVDLMPTVLDYAGVAIPADIDGKSLRRILEGVEDQGDRIVFSQRPGAGGGHWAAHTQNGTVFVTGCKTPTVDCTDTYLARRSNGGWIEVNEQTDNRVRLRRALDDYAATASNYQVPFTVTIRFRPGDKDFVKQFVLDHNMRWESYTDQDLEALGILGYVDD